MQKEEGEGTLSEYDDYLKMNFIERLGLLGISEPPPDSGSVVKSLNYDRRYYYFSHTEELLTIDAADLRGTQHASYKNRTWENAFLSLKRGWGSVKYYQNNANHYRIAPRPSPHEITIYDVEGIGKFIDQGNNRLIVAKMLNLKDIIVDSCQFIKIDHPLKTLIETLEERGFTIEKASLKESLLIKKQRLEIEIPKDVSELEFVLEQYDSLNRSSIGVCLYKLKSLFNPYYKYKYSSSNRIKNWFHKNYLDFVKDYK